MFSAQSRILFLYLPQLTSLRLCRLAFAASEVFACDVQSLLNVFFEEGNAHLLDRLFSFLARPAPLPATTAGYFRKVVGVLCSRKYEEVCALKMANSLATARSEAKPSLAQSLHDAN